MAKAEFKFSRRLESGILESHVGDCLSNGTNGVAHRFTAYLRFSGRYVSTTVSKGKKLQGEDGNICVLEGWVDVKGAAKVGPDVPGSIGGHGALVCDAQGNIVEDSAEVSCKASSAVGWIIVQEGLIG